MSSADDRPDVCVVGLGLIGTSLAAAWRRSDAVGRIIGVDPDAEARRTALDLGFVDEAHDGLRPALKFADIVMLAAPVDAVLEIAPQVAAVVEPGTVVSDVCSVKRPVVEAYEAVLRGKAAFVGGHPMAGSEQQGAGAADALLLENAAYVLTVTDATDSSALGRMQALVRAAGAYPVVMDPEAHDRAVAAVSHLPQVVASALMLAVGRQRIETRGESFSPTILAGGGLRDTTRIAGSPAHLWRGILLANAAEILTQIDGFQQALIGLREALEARDGDRLAELFAEAAGLREGVRAQQRDLLPQWPDITVRTADRPGALAEITGVLAQGGLNINDVEIVRTREGTPGSIRLALASHDQISRAMELLRRAGFEVTAP